MQYRFLPIVPLLVSIYSEAGQWQDAAQYSASYSRPKAVNLNDLPVQVLEVSIKQWLEAGFNLPEPFPQNGTKTPFQLNVTTSGTYRIEVSEASEGRFVTAFKVSEGVSKTTSTLGACRTYH